MILKLVLHTGKVLLVNAVEANRLSESGQVRSAKQYGQPRDKRQRPAQKIDGYMTK